MLIFISYEQGHKCTENKHIKDRVWILKMANWIQKKKWLSLGQEKSLKLAFLPNKLKKKYLKAEERSGVLYKEGRAYGYSREQNLRHKRSQQEIMICLRLNISIFFIPLHWAGGSDLMHINILFQAVLQPKCKLGGGGRC